MLHGGPWNLMPGQILAATDESADGRHAISMARMLSRTTDAALTMFRVVRVPASGSIPPGRMVIDRTSHDTTRIELASLDEFRSWLGPELIGVNGSSAEVAIGFGIPGIEICRMADHLDSGLIVI